MAGPFNLTPSGVRPSHRSPGFKRLLIPGIALAAGMLLTGQGHSGGPALTFMGVMGWISYWLLLPLWVYRDASERGERAWVWSLMTLMTNALGLLSYLMIRPGVRRDCPRCGLRLRDDFRTRPFCGPQSESLCCACQSPVEPDWSFCPFCELVLHRGPHDIGGASMAVRSTAQ